MALKTIQYNDGKDNSTLFRYRNTGIAAKPVEDARKRDVALQCGVGAIKLEWNDIVTSDQAVMGFQPVDLRVMVMPDRRRVPKAMPVVDVENRAVPEGTVDFVADEMGFATAYIPDTTFNRVTLAHTLIGGKAPYRIAEGQPVKAEIEKLAEQISASPEHKAAEELLEKAIMEKNMRLERRAAQNSDQYVNEIELENKVLEERIRKIEANKRREELLKKLEALKAQGLVDPSEPQPAFEKREGNAVDKELREQAKQYVYETRPDLIEHAKKNQAETTGSTRGWGRSAIYTQEILPLIQKRMEELKNADSDNGLNDPGGALAFVEQDKNPGYDEEGAE